MAWPPSCRPQLPPVIVIGAGALQTPASVRQVATPLPWLPPKPIAIFTIDGMTAIHFASRITLSGIALSGVAMISSSTFAEFSIRLSMSERSCSSADHPTPINREKMLNTVRHLGQREDLRLIVAPLLCSHEHSD